MSEEPARRVAKSPISGADVEIPADAEIGELIDDPEGNELEIVELDPPKLAPAPEEDEDWGE